MRDGRSPYQQGRDEERTAIVRWLVAWAEQARGIYATDAASTLAFAAASIKDGKHLAQGKPGEEAE